MKPKLLPVALLITAVKESLGCWKIGNHNLGESNIIYHLTLYSDRNSAHTRLPRARKTHQQLARVNVMYHVGSSAAPE
ncbi:hypothetical protein F5146DRAFT_268081 [Armillaria mellea]|nr:hypothetical protein F5146DRAFT_268081 [Armillaria mellea]